MQLLKGCLHMEGQQTLKMWTIVIISVLIYIWCLLCIALVYKVSKSIILYFFKLLYCNIVNMRKTHCKEPQNLVSSVWSYLLFYIFSEVLIESWRKRVSLTHNVVWAARNIQLNKWETDINNMLCADIPAVPYRSIIKLQCFLFYLLCKLCGWLSVLTVLV